MQASPTRRLPPGKSAGVAAATTTFEQPPDSNSEGGWSEASLPIGEAAVGPYCQGTTYAAHAVAKADIVVHYRVPDDPDDGGKGGGRVQPSASADTDGAMAPQVHGETRPSDKLSAKGSGKSLLAEVGRVVRVSSSRNS